MDYTHLHLTLVHVPIFGTFFGIVLLVLGIFSKSNTIIKVGFITFIVTALAAIPTFLTGDPSKETIENLPGISKDVINTHEEIAEKAIWFVELLGVISLIGYYFVIKTMKKMKLVVIITLLFSIITLGIMTVVGYTGGKIRHSEIDNPVSVEKSLVK
jgi:uncharacterized membrane protein